MPAALFNLSMVSQVLQKSVYQTRTVFSWKSHHLGLLAQKWSLGSLIAYFFNRNLNHQDWGTNPVANTPDMIFVLQFQ